jgi:hypothetical protein
MTKAANATKAYASQDRPLARTSAALNRHFVNSPLNETSDHLQAVLKRVNRLCDFYGAHGEPPDDFFEWGPVLLGLDKALRVAMKNLSKWEYEIKHEALKKETTIELADAPGSPFEEPLLIPVVN